MSKKDTDIAISVKNVSKSFKLPHEKQNSVKGMALNIFRGSRKYEKQQVLNDISFDVKKGEFFGIVGRNGSGKSTLLKLISQIYTPDSGSITVNGKLTPFIELGVGFNPELTGRENVFLNGALLGFTRPEMEDMYDEIVEFAELERFMDQKLKNYSSGMQVRLAFSIAIRANTDILVLDEVLAVGDEAFQRKCEDYFEKVKKQGKTIILVTHSMKSVKRYCTKALLLSEGSIVSIGDVNDVANLYTQENLDVQTDDIVDQDDIGLSNEVPILNIKESVSKIAKNDDLFYFDIIFEYKGDADIVYIAFSLLDVKRGGIIYDSGNIIAETKQGIINVGIPMKWFNDSEFKVIASLRVGKKGEDEKSKLAFTNDRNSLYFTLRNDDEVSQYALLSRSKFNIKIKQK